jgi:hypothetical protein
MWKLTFHFEETSHEPLHLDKQSFCAVKHHGHTYKFCFNH